MCTITRLGALAAGTLATAVLLSGCGALISEGVAGAGGASSSAAPSDAADTRTVYGFVLITDLGMTPEIATERGQRLWDTLRTRDLRPARRRRLPPRRRLHRE